MFPRPSERRVPNPKHDPRYRVERLSRFLANEQVDPQTVQIALLPHTMARRPKIPGRLRLNHLLMALTIAVCWLCLLADPEVGVLPPNWNAAVGTWGQASLILEALVFLDDCLSLPLLF